MPRSLLDTGRGTWGHQHAFIGGPLCPSRRGDSRDYAGLIEQRATSASSIARAANVSAVQRVVDYSCLDGSPRFRSGAAAVGFVKVFFAASKATGLPAVPMGAVVADHGHLQDPQFMALGKYFLAGVVNG